MRTKMSPKRALDLELSRFDKRQKREPQTLRIDGELFSLQGLQATIQDYQCLFCKSFPVGTIMRLDCVNRQCSALQYFCKDHMKEPNFDPLRCWYCSTEGSMVSEEHGITRLFKRSAYVSCEKAGCPELIVAWELDTHLKRECTANFVTCPCVGCNKRYVLTRHRRALNVVITDLQGYLPWLYL